MSRRKYPTMTFLRYLKRFAALTLDGKFYCRLCEGWVDKQRWIHFKDVHRYDNARAVG